MNRELLGALDEEAIGWLHEYLAGLCADYAVQGEHYAENATMKLGEWVIKQLGYPDSSLMCSVREFEFSRQPVKSETPKVKRDYRQVIFIRDGHKCVKCGSEANLTIDHIIPISKGGNESLENLQTLCRQCNCKKGTKTP